MLNINFANDWIRMTDLWYRKQPLYQMSYKQCPKEDTLNEAEFICSAYC